MFKKILIPIDPHNLENAGFSIKLAKKLITKNGTISVLSIIENVPEYIIAELPGRFIDEAKNNAKAIIQKFIAEHKLDADIVIDSGNPAVLINQAAEDDNFDLIIIASHKPNMMNYLLGSTADRVVRRAKCPVFVTR